MARTRGTALKAPGTAINPVRGQRAVLTTGGARFDPPAHIESPEALSCWDQYWADPVSSIITEADHQLLRRWIDMVERYYAALNQADAEPTVGSMGQYANPMYKIAAGMEVAIARMEARLGIGPKNRAALGIQIIEANNAATNVASRPVRASATAAVVDPR